VVDVTVREQHGHRGQPALGQHGIEALHHPDARVDDDALLTDAGGEHVAVGPERVRLNGPDQHG